jgi:hypothetical protein
MKKVASEIRNWIALWVQAIRDGLTTMVERKTGFTKAVLQKALKAKNAKEDIIVSL